MFYVLIKIIQIVLDLRDNNQQLFYWMYGYGLNSFPLNLEHLAAEMLSEVELRIC